MWLKVLIKQIQMQCSNNMFLFVWGIQEREAEEQEHHVMLSAEYSEELLSYCVSSEVPEHPGG